MIQQITALVDKPDNLSCPRTHMVEGEKLFSDLHTHIMSYVYECIRVYTHTHTQM